MDMYIEGVSSPLVKKTQSLLNEDPRTMPELYKDTGIPYFWLSKFARDEIKNPSAQKVEYLYEFFTSKKLLG